MYTVSTRNSEMLNVGEDVASESGSVEYFGPGRTADPTGGLVQANRANSQLDLQSSSRSGRPSFTVFEF